MLLPRRTRTLCTQTTGQRIPCHRHHCAALRRICTTTIALLTLTFLAVRQPARCAVPHLLQRSTTPARLAIQTVADGQVWVGPKRQTNRVSRSITTLQRYASSPQRNSICTNAFRVAKLFFELWQEARHGIKVDAFTIRRHDTILQQ